jgi:predicted transcriptional regulator
MKTTAVRGIPDDLFERIQQQAEIDRRSVNAQMVYLLERGAEVNDRIRASVQRGLAQSPAGETVDLGDFTKDAE